MAELKLGKDELAASAFRVFCYAGRVAEPDYDKLGDDEQRRWMNVGISAERVLEELDGKSFERATEAIFHLFAPELPFSQIPVEIQWAWRATTRHLATILESDEIDSLASAERFWAEWARERMQHQT
jgi:hypothetical protein